jgi:putative methionine-R-sulfoxide reductase with GAF domain
MVLLFLLSLAALWNSLLSVEVKNKGWIVLFFLLTFACGVVLFIVAFLATDSAQIELLRKSAYETGKKDILAEIENKDQTEITEQNIAETEIDGTVELILAKLKSARSKAGLCSKLLTNLANHMGFVQGIFYILKEKSDEFEISGEYALTSQARGFKIGEGLPGQVAESRSLMIVYDVPEHYFSVASGLGSSKPRYLIVQPVLFNNECIGVMELASFIKPDKTTQEILGKVAHEIGSLLSKFAVS